MKKWIIAAGAGAFIVVTALLCMNSDGKMYQKQKYFDSVNDVLTQMESNKIEEIDTNGRRNDSNEFKECLSKRKRLTFSDFDFEKIKIEKVEELDEEQKKSIMEDYNKALKRLDLPYKPTKIEPVRLDIKGSYQSHQYKDDSAASKDYIIDLVMVDEGEGMVIDYYVEHNADKGYVKKEGIVNDKY